MAQETSEDLQESQASRIEILWLSKNKTIYDPEIGLKKVARFENIRSNTDPLLKRNGKLDIEACFQERLQATIQPKISSWPFVP